MGNREAQPLPPDLLELLIEMTERLHAHEHRIEGRGGGGGGAPRASGLQPPHCASVSGKLPRIGLI